MFDTYLMIFGHYVHIKILLFNCVTTYLKKRKTADLCQYKEKEELKKKTVGKITYYHFLFYTTTASLCLTLRGDLFGCSIRSQETTLFTNMEIAQDKVTTEGGMCSTPDNGGCFSPQVVLPTCFSLCVFTLVVSRCHSSSKCVFVCVWVCAIRRPVFIPLAACVCRYTVFTRPA